MNIIWMILGIYIASGVIVLIALEAFTHRISKRMDSATLDAVGKLANSGTVISIKGAKLILALAIFAFWPAALYGAVTKEKPKSTEISPLKQRINSVLDYDLNRIIPGRKDKDGE
jgi:hypothetical protein